MTTETTTLTAWLLEQIAADEAVARAVTSGGQWTDGNYWITDYDPSDPSGQTAMQRLIGGMEQPDASHYSRYTPARILATCAAHRAIVEAADDATGLDMRVDSEFRIGRRDEVEEPYLGDVILRALAGIYADRDGFDARWVG